MISHAQAMHCRRVELEVLRPVPRVQLVEHEGAERDQLSVEGVAVDVLERGRVLVAGRDILSETPRSAGQRPEPMRKSRLK